MYANVWNDFVYRNINVIGEIFPSEKKNAIPKRNQHSNK